MLRRSLLVLIFAFFVLLVLFPVLVGGYLVADAGNDTLGFAVFRGLVVTVLVLLVVDVLLMVATLSLLQVTSQDQQQERSDSSGNDGR